MIWIPVLLLAGLFGGRLLARVESVKVSRFFGWLMLLSFLAAAHFLLSGADPIWRMTGICGVLLASMKGLVYAEWAQRGKSLPLGRYFIFGLLWFGMDPGTFREKRAALSWKSDLGWGLLQMTVGTLSAWLIWEWGHSAGRHILLMFLPLSLGFHFGALRVLKAVHRWAGFPVRTLFPNLLKAQGIGDFWSRRWNVGYSQMMQRVVGRPLGGVIGRDGGVFAVFLISGLLHEAAITLPVMAGFGLPKLYFVGHGLLAVLERRMGWQLGKILALLAVGLPLPFLFPPAFQREVIERCLGVIDYVNF
ncbi:membrane bound O-acyl transferase family-domain-containing protein [Akkermansiaceae bacterium]|nr:membrane bound O-acyl transferase family-domain-containing protein [Akkermansiaceae bacterium]